MDILFFVFCCKYENKKNATTFLEGDETLEIKPIPLAEKAKIYGVRLVTSQSM